MQRDLQLTSLLSAQAEEALDWAFGPWMLYSNSVLIHTLNGTIQVPYETLRIELMEVLGALELP